MAPNILLIFSDQHRYDCLGAHGHPFLATPNLDRLAAEGASFPLAFTPIPICVPARASLLTGQWPAGRLPHGHQALANTDSEVPRPMRTDLPTFTQCLADAGYWLGMAGKWQVHPQLGPQAFGFHEYRPDSDYPAWRAAQGLPPRPHTNSWFGEPDPGVLPEQSRLGWGATQTIELIRLGAQNAAASGQPFFVRWDPSEPHLPNLVPEPYASLYPPEQVPPWPGFDDPLEGKPYIQKKMRQSWQIEGWPWQRWAPTVARYLGEISLLDAQVGRLLAELDRLGLAETTLVVYSCDHGDLCGSHGMIDKHNVMYDDVLRVPLLMRWPGHIAPGARPDGFTSHAIDLASTFLAAAGVPIPATFTGLNLLPQAQGAAASHDTHPDRSPQFDSYTQLFRDTQLERDAHLDRDTTPVRDDIFATYHGSQFGLYSQRAVRDRRWKYVWNTTAEDELYDLSTDPGEIHNRALDPACRAELTRLRARLLAWMESIHDPLVNGWTRNQLTT